MIQNGVLTGAAGRACCVIAYGVATGSISVSEWDVLSSNTKKMATEFSKDDPVIWPHNFKVKVIFNLENHD